MSKAYKAAGVDIHAGYQAVELIKPYIKDTFREGVIGGFGSFGGLFSLAKIKEMDEPIMVSGTDSVGTKVMLAFEANKHDTIGIDCVAMCVNDIVCCGAEPLFFLDYIGLGKNIPEKTALIVKGVADGCKMAGAALIGGEMAEMAGVYKEDEYDLVGFASGVVDRKNIIDGRNIKAGDVIIGLASSGLHSNGYSLVRKVFANDMAEHIDALLAPTKIYVKPLLDLISKVKVKGISNITGGGLLENVPRMMPKGTKAVIKSGSWNVPEIFRILPQIATKNNIPIDDFDMYNTYNMGIGMALVVNKNDADKTISVLELAGEKAFIIGTVEEQNTIPTDNNFELEGIKICLK